MEKINNSNFDFLRENLRKHYEKLDQETVVKENGFTSYANDMEVYEPTGR